MPKVDDVVRAYVILRDRKEELARKHKDEMKPLTTQMETCEAWLQKHLLDTGQTSAQTAEGTAFLHHATSATVRDWPATLKWIKDNDEWSFLDSRVNKTAVKSYLEDKGEAPPGVNYSETVVTRIRRK